MQENIAISLKNVSKCFKRYARPVDRLKELILSNKSYAQEFWALRDISFEINKGETVGIIGRNGAGKSTLLQLICKTLTPTNGELLVNGRVAALLELGAGFNPEFTGRENVYMNGAIMGLSKLEVDESFDNIAAFADIKDFIDQPVKAYSSGMYVRLAFASAIHVQPDILIVDEALAVGDMFFQAKCMARMRQMMESGVTVLFVSHDTSSVKALCQRGVFLENGELKQIGKASEVVSIYTSLVHQDMNQDLKNHLKNKNQESSSNQNTDSNEQNIQQTNNSEELNHRHISEFISLNSSISNIFVSLDQEVSFLHHSYRYGDGGARILDVKLIDSNKKITNLLELHEKYFIQISIRFDKLLPSFCVGYSFRDLKGQQVIGSVSTVENIEMPNVEIGDVYIVEISSVNVLHAGNYTIAVGVEMPVLINQQHIIMDVVEEAMVFESKWPEDNRIRFPSMVYIKNNFNILKC
ncbi:ATP-binding cassette domain-containing protein [Pseudanabaena sp. FACHB-1998]|uniref:ABC transporter ATP-binding protein n=1 Tax=Pseudanabaena sp. FACHB-1998 TaxID=2692858 RepID=UPI00167FF6FA|nr:ABC transporter ATP-binding protein [Pseudanabaena sp. FACHB-1998]MBD2177255.1 ATP-binding cassette domain-containing protein [Pseudanabaena sp. FACHB-1998]